jgi:S-adenosylmethionine hydrolase
METRDGGGKFMRPSGIITLLTDFGQRDGYVAAMKGVMLGLHPAATLIDLSHEVDPQNVQAGAFLLQTHFRYFPLGTVHVAVIDPGVGSERAALACYAGGHVFVAPDNGLLDFCLDFPDQQAVGLTQKKFWRETISSTFHGRDIFAPVAAHLSRGESLLNLGAPFELQRRLPALECRMEGKTLHGQIAYIDRFGNLITNISEPRLREFSQGQPVTIMLAGNLIGGLSQTYSDAPPHAPLALIGSFGFLEISVNFGNAQSRFNARLGAPVTVARGQLI